MTEPTNPPISAAKTQRPLLIASLALLLLVGGIILFGFSYERVYAGEFYPGVEVLGLSLAGKTVAQAKALVEAQTDKVLNQTIKVSFPDMTTTSIQPKDFGLTFDSDQLVDQAFLAGRTGSPLMRWSHLLSLGLSGANFTGHATFDQEKLKGAVDHFLQSHDKNLVNAKLASVDGQLSIQTDQPGFRLNRDDLVVNLEGLIQNAQAAPTIMVHGQVLEPDLTAADLRTVKLTGDQLIRDPLILAIDHQLVTIPSATLASWLVVDTTAMPVKLTWNQDLLHQYVADLAKKTDQAMHPRKVSAQGTTLVDGQLGHKLDQTAALTTILAALTKRVDLTTVTSDPVLLTETDIPITDVTDLPSSTPGLYPGKYIEVNLKDQRLYQYEGDNLIATYPVSTGKWSTPTPIGTLYVKNHIEYAYSQEHNLYMPWWLGLAWNQDGSGYEGYGIHELPEWPGGRKEGEGHLGTPVSHGCIRLGVGPAKVIYDWAEEGMPVYVHR